MQTALRSIRIADDPAAQFIAGLDTGFTLVPAQRPVLALTPSLTPFALFGQHWFDPSPLDQPTGQQKNWVFRFPALELPMPAACVPAGHPSAGVVQT
jgi:hypothetical protein